MNTLESATEKLYEVFRKYPLKVGLRDRSCPCCVSDDEIRDLTSKPLRGLSINEIGHFVRSAVTTFGDIDDLKHFLPRILELFQDESYDLVDDFLTFEKLNYTEWQAWEAIEIEAIEEYFLSLWESVVMDEKCSNSQLENVLVLASKYVCIKKALEIWNSRCSKRSVELIVEHILDGSNFGLSEFDQDTFWKWASSQTVLEKIEELFFETKDELEASRISVAYTLVEKMN